MRLDNIFSNPKVRLALVIGLVVIVVGIIFFWWWTQRAIKPIVLEPKQVVPANGSTETTTEPVIVAPTGAELSVVSRNFVERYGSFSNQSNKQNIKDVLSMATPAMQARLNQITNQDASQGYTGIETRVVSISVVSQTSSEAELKIKAQRSARSADLKTNLYYQDIVLSLIKTGDQWLVDRADWQ
jgi:hypothetical protein